MVCEYEKLNKKWKKVVNRYTALNDIWLCYKEEGSEEQAKEYLHEMLSMEIMAGILGYDLHELLRSYKEWQKTHVEKE